MKDTPERDPSAPSFGRRDAGQSITPDTAKASPPAPPIGDNIEAGGHDPLDLGQSKSPNTLRPSAPKRRRQLDHVTNASADQMRVIAAAAQFHTKILEKLDTGAASKLKRDELATQLHALVSETLAEHNVQMNQVEQRDIVTMLVNDMIGLGPLETLMSDDSVTDILVNGPGNIYIERAGKLELTDLKFRDKAHVMDIAIRIANRVGRHVDETRPYVDARLSDGSRVNIIIPPLALKGPNISVRKFAKKPITLDVMVQQRNLSAEMATVLKVAARSRLSILISGGTGSGKTTLLNALSQLIDPGERIITIEDAAELQLQQPHVVPLETRMVNIEGKGEVIIRDLVRNALRMRPDKSFWVKSAAPKPSTCYRR